MDNSSLVEVINKFLCDENLLNEKLMKHTRISRK